MSLNADIGTVADDIRQRAEGLQAEFETMLQNSRQGTPLWNDLYALKLRVSSLKMESIRLTTLTGAARMTGDLPKERALAPVEHLPLFKTRSPEEPLRQARADQKMKAAGDHTFDDDTTK